MRHTRAHTANRRSHHALKATQFSKCPKCGAAKMPHVLCEKCGTYRGKVILDVVKAVEKKQSKAKGKKEAK